MADYGKLVEKYLILDHDDFLRAQFFNSQGMNHRRRGAHSIQFNSIQYILTNGAQVDAAAVIIIELLTPKDDNENEWKRMQLRELAMINGTLRFANPKSSSLGFRV
jgi:hypothetical protein